MNDPERAPMCTPEFALEVAQMLVARGHSLEASVRLALMLLGYDEDEAEAEVASWEARLLS